MNNFALVIDDVGLLDLGNFGVQFGILFTQVVMAFCAVFLIVKGSGIYRKQKNIDRFELKKDKVINKLINLDSKVKKALIEIKKHFNEKRFFGEEKESSKESLMKKILSILDEILYLSVEITNVIGKMIEEIEKIKN